MFRSDDKSSKNVLINVFRVKWLYFICKITYLVEWERPRFLANPHCNHKQLHLQCNHLYHLYIDRFDLDHRQVHHIKSENVCVSMWRTDFRTYHWIWTRVARTVTAITRSWTWRGSMMRFLWTITIKANNKTLILWILTHHIFSLTSCKTEISRCIDTTCCSLSKII